MPRYDYECGTCHHRFELKQSFNTDPVADCPVCGRSSHRMFHAVPVVFKGSGWYVNDYGRRGSASDSRSDSKESADSKSKPEKKPDSAAKAQAKAGAKSKSESASAKGD